MTYGLFFISSVCCTQSHLCKDFYIYKENIRHLKFLHYQIPKNGLVPIVFHDFETLNVINFHLSVLYILNLLLCLYNNFRFFFYQGFEEREDTAKTQKGGSMNAKLTWCVLWSIQIKRDLRGPISSPLLLLSCHAYPFLFPSSSVFLSLCLTVQSCLSISHTHPPPLHSFPYFTMWKVTQNFPSRVFADRKSIFNEVTLLLKCF